MSERRIRSSSHGTARIAAGAGLLTVGGLLLIRTTALWPGDAIVWPAASALLGALLIWRAPPRRASPGRPWAAQPASGERLGRARRRTLARPEVSRRGLGVALVLAAGIAFLWADGDVRPAGEALLAALAVLIAAALIFAPSWRNLARSLNAERTERIRSQERADVAAHLHDSVLQTLALIQRGADDPRRVASLARTQERELRAWLAAEEQQAGAGAEDGRLAGALQATAIELELATGSAIELVTVGDCALDNAARTTLAAAREAMLNAAKFACATPAATVSVYAELSPRRIEVFVRDRGVGFDQRAIPPERRGVRESIVGRMRRAGGSARVRSGPGQGTEVELSIERHGA